MAEETKNTKPADEEIEKTAEPTAGEEKQPETEKAESDTAAAKEEQPEKKSFFGKKKEKKDKKDEQIEELTDRSIYQRQGNTDMPERSLPVER